MNADDVVNAVLLAVGLWCVYDFACWVREKRKKKKPEDWTPYD